MDYKNPKNLTLILTIVFTILFIGLCFVNILAAAIALIIDMMVFVFGVLIYNSDLKASI